MFIRITQKLVVNTDHIRAIDTDSHTLYMQDGGSYDVDENCWKNVEKTISQINWVKVRQGL